MCKTNKVFRQDYGHLLRLNGLCGGDLFSCSQHIINPRTPKPLTFSKNRLQGAKNRSNTSAVAKKKAQICECVQKKKSCIFACFKYLFKNAQIPEIFLNFFYRSIHNTYLNDFIKKNCKKTQKKKKKLHICKTNYNGYERFGGSQSRFFERNNGLGDIGNSESSRIESNAAAAPQKLNKCLPIIDTVCEMERE
ncbi:hypothetical protein LXL04_029734 [Taraxacum kok-saghyz]